MKNQIAIATLLLSVGWLAACEQDNSAGMCAQADAFMDKAEAGPLVPRDWGQMMLAGARLVYATEQCGERVGESVEALCADLGRSIVEFASNPNIPAGDNRTSALNQNLKVYQGAGCEPELSVQ